MGEWSAHLRDFLRVETCPGCGETLPHANEYGPFCRECRGKWEREKLKPCETCSLAAIDCRCLPRELRRSEAVREAVFLVSYRTGGGSLPDRVVYRVKEYAEGGLFRFLARELSYGVKAAVTRATAEEGRVCITALPGRKAALRARGYDQAVLLARALSEVTGYPYEPLLVRAGGGRRAQKELSLAERRENMKGAFLPAREDLAGRTVLLVDDLMTTGAGMAAGAEVLRRAGAGTVIPVTVARTTT